MPVQCYVLNSKRLYVSLFHLVLQRRPGKIPMSGQLPHGVLPSLPHGLNQPGIHGLPRSPLVSQHGVHPLGVLQSLPHGVNQLGMGIRGLPRSPLVSRHGTHPHGVNQLGVLQSLHGIRVVTLIMTSIGSTQRKVISSDMTRRDGIFTIPSGVISSVKYVVNAVRCLTKIRITLPKLSVCHSMTVWVMDAMVASIWTTKIIMDCRALCRNFITFGGVILTMSCLAQTFGFCVHWKHWHILLAILILWNSLGEVIVAIPTPLVMGGTTLVPTEKRSTTRPFFITLTSILALMKPVLLR